MKNPSTMNTNFNNSLILNNSTYNDYMNRFRKIATSMFEWINLPKSCNSRWLELCLYWYGKASFLYDNQFGFINTQAIPSGELNLYGLPTSINCLSYTYNSQRTLYDGVKNYPKESPADDDECILIMNNYDMIPTESTLQLFALRLYEAERTIDVNVKSQKTPVMLICDEKQRLTLMNLYKKYDGNEPFIFGDKNIFSNGIQIDALKTDAPYIVDKIMDYKKQIWNEALTFLGINNIMEEKKERLTENESNVNNELINMNLQSYLLTRKEACKQINEKFGLDVDVKVRSDLKNIIKSVDTTVNDYLDNSNITIKDGEVNE